MGKTEEFEELYSESRDRLAGQLYALTGDAHGAYDLVQEAFVRTWMRWDRIAGYDDREAFVRRVAFNLAKSNFRKLRRAVLRSSPPDVAVSGPDSSARDELVAGLRTLSEKEREAIVLRYIAGLTVDEVAAQMGAPSGTVKSWLSRGRAHLAQHLVIDVRPTEEVTPNG